MATTTSITTTYAGVFAKKYIQATLLAAKTMDNITQHLNINNKYVIKKYANAASFANASCDFADTGTVTLTELILNPKQLQWQQQLCKLDFLADWEAMEMGFGNNRQIPKLFGDFMLNSIAETATAKIEELLWTGDASNAGEFDGFAAQKSFTADIAGAIIDESNVIAELQSVVDAIPTTVKGHRTNDLFLYVPTQVMFAYTKAQNDLGSFQNPYADFARNMFSGIPMVECPGMPDNSMWAARKSNLHFATGLLSDFTDIRFIDQSNIDGSDNVNISLKFSGDTGIGFLSEAIWYAYGS